MVKEGIGLCCGKPGVARTLNCLLTGWEEEARYHFLA
jgi:hypothetical protein